MADNVKSPPHYTHGGVELVDIWRKTMSFEALCGLFWGNVTKYLWRYKHKNGLEDLKKARQYLDWLIEEVEKEEQTPDD